MLDSLFDTLKAQAISSLTGQAGITSDQAQAAMPLAKDAVSEGLMGAATSGNFGAITEMFKSAAGGGSTGGGLADLAQNAVYASIATKFLSKLTSSLGLSPAIAQTVSSVALPMIISKIGGAVTKDGGGSMDLGAITKLLGGGAADGAAGILGQAAGMLGGMFGKK